VLGARSHFFIQAQTLLGTRGPTTPFAVSMVPDRHFLVYSGPPSESSMCVEALVPPAVAAANLPRTAARDALQLRNSAAFCA
jgi:hypothetical protein